MPSSHQMSASVQNTAGDCACIRGFRSIAINRASPRDEVAVAQTGKYGPRLAYGLARRDPGRRLKLGTPTAMSILVRSSCATQFGFLAGATSGDFGVMPIRTRPPSPFFAVFFSVSLTALANPAFGTAPGLWDLRIDGCLTFENLLFLHDLRSEPASRALDGPVVAKDFEPLVLSL